jgi:hypothetical protein
MTSPTSASARGPEKSGTNDAAAGAPVAGLRAAATLSAWSAPPLFPKPAMPAGQGRPLTVKRADGSFTVLP